MSKLIKSLLVCLLFTLAVSCVSTPTQQDDYVSVERGSNQQVSQVQYNGQCAYAVSQGQFKVESNKDIMYRDGQKTYYFANQSARQKFLRNKQASVRRANEYWANRTR